MSTTLLATKFSFPPSRGKRVMRHRLMDALAAGQTGKLTLVSAPAGFGKSTLAADFLRTRPINESASPQHTAWLTLDEGDNDAHRFWTYLLSAVQRISPDLGRGAMELLGVQPPPSPETFLGLLINDLAACMLDPTPVVVLDDLHLIQNNIVFEGLLFLLEHLPAGWHLTFLTRSDPPLPLARLRAQNLVTDIRADQLRFTLEEAREYLQSCSDLDLPAEDTLALETRTEGWIAGLQMAAVSIRSRPDASGFVRDFAASPRFALDYLLEEVLQREDESAQSFLLQTSVLGRFCASLCDAVTGREDSHRMIDRLDTANLFISPLDPDREWFRYHSLFADLLSRQLQKTDPVVIPSLHRRACEWHARAGNLPQAIQHALASRDFEQAADLVERSARLMFDLGELETLIGWLRAIPEYVLIRRSWLCVYQAWMLMLAGKAEKIESRLRDAEAALTEASLPAEEAGRIRAYCSVIRGQVAIMRGDFPETIRLAEAALPLLAPEDQNAASSAMAILGGAYGSMGNFQKAVPILERTKSLSRGGNPFNAIMSSAAVAQMSAACGRLHEADRLLSEAIREIEAHNSPMAAAGLGYLQILRADILREWGRCGEAMELAETGLTLCRILRLPELTLTGCGIRARILRSTGDLDGAIAVLEETAKTASDFSDRSLADIASQQARLHITAGNLEFADRWAERSGLTQASEAEFRVEYGLLTLARLLLAHRKADDALAVLERVQKNADAGGRNGVVLETRILQALGFSIGNREDDIKEALSSALETASAEGYARLFLDEGEQLMKIIVRAAVNRSIPGWQYAQTLLSHTSEANARNMPVGAFASAAGELSEREMEVLRLLAAGLSNPAISERLMVSVNTVKAHVKSIYSKLETHNRTEAINRARELDLF